MSNCLECYHLIKQNNETYFCFVRGFLKNLNINLCFEFHQKNTRTQVCPNCTSLYRESSSYCKQCEIYNHRDKGENPKPNDFRVDNIRLPFYKELHYIL